MTPHHFVSGGNDNSVLVWDLHYARPSLPKLKYMEHQAGIKAMAFSPHRRGVLVTGGGTQDRSLRVWNTLSMSPHSLDTMPTQAQVCNVLWSPFNESLLSTHGFTVPEIALWEYPGFVKWGSLTGHTHRVLYVTLSPNGEDICTGAGDGTLRFWHVFDHPTKRKGGYPGSMFLRPPYLSSSTSSTSSSSSLLSSPSSSSHPPPPPPLPPPPPHHGRILHGKDMEGTEVVDHDASLHFSSSSLDLQQLRYRQYR
ncbi:substrate-specific activator of APC-dependent proteolysis [Coelomomyces lativittatus]|nr:substrate-specific activator of APC-dependent proteolysis [Coelomomyces lativittatus]